MKNTPIKLNNRDYALRYDLNSLAYIEDNLGIPITQLDTSRIGAKALLVCIYAGLMWDRRNCPSRLEVGSWIASMEDYEMAMEKMTIALKEAFGKKEDEPDKDLDPKELMSQEAGSQL